MKTQLVLLIYATLIKMKVVVRKDFCSRHAISERTFYRYMAEIVAFLHEDAPTIVVDVIEPDGKYYLKK